MIIKTLSDLQTYVLRPARDKDSRMRAHARTHALTHTHARTHARARPHARTPARTHAHTHTHTHTHGHTHQSVSHRPLNTYTDVRVSGPLFSRQPLGLACYVMLLAHNCCRCGWICQSRANTASLTSCRVIAAVVGLAK